MLRDSRFRDAAGQDQRKWKIYRKAIVLNGSRAVRETEINRQTIGGGRKARGVEVSMIIGL